MPAKTYTLPGDITIVNDDCLAHLDRIVGGTIVTDPQVVMTGIGQGICFHQLRQKKAVRLVTLQKGIPLLA